MMNSGGAQVFQANHLQLIGRRGKTKGKRSLMASLAGSLFAIVPGAGKGSQRFGGVLKQLQGLRLGLGIQVTHQPAKADQGQLQGSGTPRLRGAALVKQQPGTAKAPALWLGEANLLPQPTEGPEGIVPLPAQIGVHAPVLVQAESGIPAGSSKEASNQPGSGAGPPVRGQHSRHDQVTQPTPLVQGPPRPSRAGNVAGKSQAAHGPPATRAGQSGALSALMANDQPLESTREPPAQPQLLATQMVGTRKGKSPAGNIHEVKFAGGQLPGGNIHTVKPAGGQLPGGNIHTVKPTGGQLPEGNIHTAKLAGGQLPDGNALKGNIPAGKLPELETPDGKRLDVRNSRAPKALSEQTGANTKASTVGVSGGITPGQQPQAVVSTVIPQLSGDPDNAQLSRSAGDDRSRVFPVWEAPSDGQVRPTAQRLIRQQTRIDVPTARRVHVIRQPRVQQVTNLSNVQPTKGDVVEIRGETASVTAGPALNQGKPEHKVSLMTDRPEVQIVEIRSAGRTNRSKRVRGPSIRRRITQARPDSQRPSAGIPSEQVKGNGSNPANSLTNESRSQALFQPMDGDHSGLTKSVNVGVSINGEHTGDQTPAPMTLPLPTPTPTTVPVPANLASMARLTVLQYNRFVNGNQNSQVFSFDGGSLGNVRMTFTEGAAGTALYIAVDSPVMQHMLQRALPNLEQGWTQQGLNFTNVNVEVGHSGSENGSLERENTRQTPTLPSEVSDEDPSEFVEEVYRDYGYNTVDLVA